MIFVHRGGSEQSERIALHIRRRLSVKAFSRYLHIYTVCAE